MTSFVLTQRLAFRFASLAPKKQKKGCLTQWRVYRPRRSDRWIVVIRLADDNGLVSLLSDDTNPYVV